MSKCCGIVLSVLLLVGTASLGADGSNEALEDYLAFRDSSSDSTVEMNGEAGTWLAQATEAPAATVTGTSTDAAPGKAPPLPLHTIEGVGGCLIVPVAYLVNPGPEGTIFGMPSVSFTYINTSNTKSMQVFAVTQTFFRRIELGYALARFWWLREVAAVSKAWLDLNLLHPTPVLGEQLPIT